MSISLVSFVVAMAPLLAEDEAFPPPGNESANYRSDVVIEGLDNPCGLVARPAVGPEQPREILFIESGAGRVLKFSERTPNDTLEVLTGLSGRTPSEGMKLRTSGWRLGFITQTKLAVLGGSKNDGAEQLAVYVLPDDGKSITAEQIDHVVLIVDYRESEPLLFPGMVVGETAAFLTGGSARGGGIILKATLAANRIEQPKPLHYIKADEDPRWPSGSCLSPSGRTRFLVTGYVGELSEKLDGRITFIVPSSDEVALDLACGLHDIVDLAYSPSGQLYALDLGWHDEKAGGVYRLDDARLENRPACRTVKIAEVVRPTSLMFDATGALYVTSLGKGEKAKRGSVIKITGEF